MDRIEVEIDNLIVVEGDFNTPPSIMDRQLVRQSTGK